MTPKQLEQFLRVIEERYNGIEDHDKQPTTFLREVADTSLVECIESLTTQNVGRYYSHYYFICLKLRHTLRTITARQRTKPKHG